MGMSLMVINHSNLTTTAPISSPPLSQKELYGIRATPSAKVLADFFCHMEEGREKDGKKMKKKRRKTCVSGKKGIYVPRRHDTRQLEAPGAR
nr:hypothetical protein Iba_chr05dCG13930 [Ipomoea batatas]